MIIARMAASARIAPWAALAVLSLALSAPAHAQSPWPAPAKGPGQFPAANPPAAGPGQFPPANAAAPAAGPGQFPAANAPQSLPQQPGAVPPPSQWGNAGGGAPAGQHPAWGARPGGAPGQLPCADEVTPLRDDAQAKSVVLKAMIDQKKGDRETLCKAFKTFSAAEGKMVKFVQDHGARCGFPPEVAKGAKANHSKTVGITNRVCNAAAGPGAPPPPSLSDALGTSRIPDASNIKTGKGGTFDTLSGSTLAR